MNQVITDLLLSKKDCNEDFQSAVKQLRETRKTFWKDFFEKFGNHNEESDEPTYNVLDDDWSEWVIKENGHNVVSKGSSDREFEKGLSVEIPIVAKSLTVGCFKTQIQQSPQQTPSKTASFSKFQTHRFQNESFQSMDSTLQHGSEERDILCLNCQKATMLPPTWFQKQDHQRDPFCNSCLIENSEHSECIEENCQVCQQLAEEILERNFISQSYLKQERTQSSVQNTTLNRSNKKNQVVLSPSECQQFRSTDEASKSDQILFDDEVLCQVCCNPTKIPLAWFKSYNPQKDQLCIQCLVEKSTHKECCLENCNICQRLAEEMQERTVVSEYYQRKELLQTSVQNGDLSVSSERKQKPLANATIANVSTRKIKVVENSISTPNPNETRDLNQTITFHSNDNDDEEMFIKKTPSWTHSISLPINFRSPNASQRKNSNLLESVPRKRRFILSKVKKK